MQVGFDRVPFLGFSIDTEIVRELATVDVTGNWP